MRTMKQQRNDAWKQGLIVIAIIALLKILSPYVVPIIVDYLSTHIYKGLCLELSLWLVLVTNVLFAMSIRTLSVACTDTPLSFVTSIFPIWCDINLIRLYLENETGESKIPIVNLAASIINFLVFWIGIEFVDIKYGFLIMYGPHFVWIILSFVTFFINTCLRAKLIGDVIFDWDKYLTSNSIWVLKYIPTVLLCTILGFYLILGPALAVLNVSNFFLNSRLFNFLAISTPLILPVFSAIGSFYLSHTMVTAVAEEDYNNAFDDEDDDMEYEEDYSDDDDEY